MRSGRFGRSSGSPPVMRSFLHAGAHEHARQAQDLREVQPLAAVQEAVRLVERLARHAVRAAEVAAIHDRDAQVVDRAAQRDRRGGRVRTRAAAESRFRRRAHVLTNG